MYPNTFEALREKLKAARISPRLIRDVRYAPDSIQYLSDRDFLAVSTKSGNEGVLLYAERIVPFVLTKRQTNSTGRTEAIICDICVTWQRGSNSAMLTLKKSATHTISHLVCADLDCSLHVRGLTDASKLSRTQLREHISPEDRIRRMRQRLSGILAEV